MEYVSLVISMVVCFAMAMVIRSQGSKNPIYNVFFSATILTTFWSLLAIIFLNSQNMFENEIISRLYMFSVGIFPTLLIYLSYNFPRREQKQPIFLYVFYGLVGISLIFFGNILFSQISIPNKEFSNFSDITRIFINIFCTYFQLGIVISAFFNLRNLWRFKSKIKDTKTVFAIGFLTVFAVIMSAIFNFIFPVFFHQHIVTSHGTLAVAVLLSTYIFGFWRFGPYDFYPAALKTIAYILSEFVVILIYIMAFRFALTEGGEMNGLSVLTGTFLVVFFTLSFGRILSFFSTILSRWFDKRQNIDIFLEKFTQNLAQTTDLKKLLEKLSGNIADILGATKVQFFIKFGADQDKNLNISNRRVSKIAPKDLADLEEYVKEDVDGVVLVSSELFGMNEEIVRMFKANKWNLVVPLRADNNIVGFIFINQTKGKKLRAGDVNIIRNSYNSLMTAINSAIAVYSVRDINSTLEQRTRNATKDLRRANQHLTKLDESKDEFISMASHQLRTPLTSIKGYVSMILDGDAGKINETQKHFLTEAFVSSERMVRIINDFLNVSRLQTGKFILDKTDGDLVEVVKEEVESLRSAAQARDLELDFASNLEEIKLHIDFDKLRQVIMNMIDNAIYYSKPNSKIEIRIEEKEGRVEFLVIDTGIGVPLQDQAGLFTKFHRGKNARKQRPDGTGVGLYLARRIVMAHKGDVIFKSEENKGSTFGFWLPLK